MAGIDCPQHSRSISPGGSPKRIGATRMSLIVNDLEGIAGNWISPPLWRPEICVVDRAMTIRPSDRRRYRVIAASLRPEDIAAADRIVNSLRDEGWPNANRSLVIREALAALADVLKDRPPEEVFRHFIERRGRRIPSVKPTNAA